MENQIIRNYQGEMLINSAHNLENEFLKAFAAEEEILGGETSARPNPEEPNQPLSEGNEIKQILEKPEGEIPETVSFGRFTIDESEDNKSKLMAQGLSESDAKEKSCYIKYIDPDTGEEKAVQGPMMGMNRENGVGEEWVGGIATRKEIQEDLEKMKKQWNGGNDGGDETAVEGGGSEGGFPVDHMYMLVDLNELSSDLVAYKKHKQNELPKKVEVQEEEAKEVAEKEKEELQPELEVPETEVPENAPSKTTPQPSLPKPIKKVPAFLMDIRLKRESRLQRLKNIKGY